VGHQPWQELERVGTPILPDSICPWAWSELVTMYSSHGRFGALCHVIRNIRTILSWLYVSAEKSYCRLIHYIKTLNTFLLCVFRESVMGELARWVRYTMQCMRMRDIWCQKVCLSVRLSVTIRYRILIHDLLLSSIFQHRDYNELTTHNLNHAVKRDVNSVENDRLIALITTMN